MSRLSSWSFSALAVLAACPGKDATSPPIRVASVTVSPATATILVDQTVQLAATMKDASGTVLTGRSVTWASSNTSVATVSATGLVTGIAPGPATTITATSEGQSGMAAISVNVAMSEVHVALSSTSSTSEYVVAIDGGGYGTTPQVTSVVGQSMTSAVLVLSVPAGGPYRIRAIDAQTGTDAATKLVTQSGKVESVSVPSGLVVDVSVSLTPISVSITAPGSVAAGSLYQVSWTYTDPGSVLTAEGRFSSGSSSFTDLNAPCCNVLAQGTELSTTSRQFVADLTAPQTAGTVYYQVINQSFGLGPGRNGFVVSPSTTRGESLGQVAVTTATSGLQVSLSSPSPTDEYVVAVDGGVYGTVPQVASITGQGMTSATLSVSVPPGGSYRIRAVAVQPGSATSAPIMNASGKTENVTVTAGSFTNVSIALAPIAVTITAPSSVTAAAPYQVSWTYTDPGSALDRASTAEARFSSGSAPFTDLNGPCCNILVLGTVLSPTSRRFTANLVAPQTPGSIYFQVIAQTFNVGTSRNGWYVNPSTIRGETLTQISVVSGTVLSFTAVSAGAGYTCGIIISDSAYCWGNGRTTPVPVPGGLTFLTLVAGTGHTCGIATDRRAYCWGNNGDGQLGNGTRLGSSVPVAVTGDLRFSSISVGYRHTCGVTVDGLAYCWGTNFYGELGTSITTECTVPSNFPYPCSTTPVPVAGGLQFASVSTTPYSYHTCGVTIARAAYCWGYNGNGQLGIGSFDDNPHPAPALVLGDHTFGVVTAGGGWTCGAATDGVAYCWGYNFGGELGTGSSSSYVSAPARVASGTVMFVSVTAGAGHTCAVASDGAAYCWGANYDGRFGDGSRTSSAAPVPVSGGLTFRMVTAGSSHTCGLTTSDVAYCWGFNSSGELGNGTTDPSTVPVRVSGQP